MTRVVDGIFDTAELDTGFFIPDNQVDLLCEWLGAYADALERAWVKNGSDGDPKIQKFNRVRSFLRAVERHRGIKDSEVTK